MEDEEDGFFFGCCFLLSGPYRARCSVRRPLEEEEEETVLADPIESRKVRRIEEVRGGLPQPLQAVRDLGQRSNRKSMRLNGYDEDDKERLSCGCEQTLQRNEDGESSSGTVNEDDKPDGVACMWSDSPSVDMRNLYRNEVSRDGLRVSVRTSGRTGSAL